MRFRYGECVNDEDDTGKDWQDAKVPSPICSADDECTDQWTEGWTAETDETVGAVVAETVARVGHVDDGLVVMCHVWVSS